MTTPAIQAQLTASLLTTHSLAVSPTWLTTFLASSRQPLPPLPALTSTARFRILASDIKTSLSPTAGALPVDINDVNVKERRLNTDIIVQVLDITDIGASKWSQIEAIERVERGEEVRGREVIRNVPIMNEDDDAGAVDGGAGARAHNRATNGESGTTTNNKKSPGPHKLILQDVKGTNATAFEMIELPRVYIGEGGMSIGCKLVLRKGCLVRRGMVMMSPENVVVLGGRIESWDKKWKEDRKVRLVTELETLQGGPVRAGG